MSSVTSAAGRAPRVATVADGGMTTLRLPDPYDFELSTARYRTWGRDLANVWEDGALWRAVGGREVRIAAAEGGVDVEPFDEVIGVTVHKLLGAEFDLESFYAFAATHAVLSRVAVAVRGLRPPLAPDPFEALVTSITAQQVSLHAAFAIRGRFVELLGQRAGRVWSFPTRERVALADEAELVAVGYSRRKADYIVGLARSHVDLDALAVLPDDEVKARLVALRGIGEWTAEWFLARHLARPRAWPVGDVGLRKAVAHFTGDPDERAARPRFAPFENLSAHYLLAALYSGVGS